MSDLIQRLRGDPPYLTSEVPLWARLLCKEAADELERLTRELAEAQERYSSALDDGLRKSTMFNEAIDRAERAEAERDDALRMLDRAASYHAALLADREQLRAALAECARVMQIDEPRFNEWHDAISDAERLSRVSHKPVVDARAFDQAHGLRDDPITGGIADRPLQIDQTK